MTRRPALYVVASQSPGNVVPLRFASMHGTALRTRARVLPLREASWRDLVRRLSKSPVKN